MDKVTGQCPQTTTFLKRKENRSGIEREVLPLSSLTPYGQLGQTGSRTSFNTLDNCGHKISFPIKKKKDRKGRSKDHGPGHTQCTRSYIYILIVSVNSTGEN